MTAASLTYIIDMANLIVVNGLDPAIHAAAQRKASRHRDRRRRFLLQCGATVSIYDRMMLEQPRPTLSDHLHRLLEAVKDACGVEGRRGLFAGPMALLVWLQTRRMRKEAAAMAEQFKLLLERFVVLWDNVLAGKPGEPVAPPAPVPPERVHFAAEPPSTAERVMPKPRRTSARPRQIAPTPPPSAAIAPRCFSAPAAVTILSHGSRPETQPSFPHDRRPPASTAHAGSRFLNGTEASGDNCAHFVTVSKLKDPRPAVAWMERSVIRERRAS